MTVVPLAGYRLAAGNRGVMFGGVGGSAITTDIPRALHPGEGWVRKDGTAVVRAGDAGIELLEGQIDARILDRRALGELLGDRHSLA